MTARAAQPARKPEPRPLAPHVAAAIRRPGAPQTAQPARASAVIQRMEEEDYETWVVDIRRKIAIRDDGGFLATESHLRNLGYRIWQDTYWELISRYPHLILSNTLSKEFTEEEKMEMEEVHKTHRSGGGALKWTGGDTKSIFFQGQQPQGWAEGEKEFEKLRFVTGSDQPRRTGITNEWTYVGESASMGTSHLGSFMVLDSHALGFEGEDLISSGMRLDPSVGPNLPFCPGHKSGRRVLTWGNIQPFRGGTRSTKGGKHTQAMNNVSAGNAAAAAGYVDIRNIGDPHNSSSTKKANYQWLHLIAYSLGGLDGHNPDQPGNLVVGTSMANGFMELVEALIAEALEADLTLALELLVDVEMIDTTYHIPGLIVYTIGNVNNPTHYIRYEFEPMSTWPSYSGDKRFSREFFRASLGL